MRDFEVILRWAAARYNPRPYVGRMVLFRSNERLLRRQSDAPMGWGDLVTGEVRVYDLTGAHHDMFLEPNVAITARPLSDELRQAQGKTADAEPMTRLSENPPVIRPVTDRPA